MRKITLLAVFVLAFWGCATFSQNYKLGTKAAMNKDWDEAVRYYEKAVWESPKNSVYRLALLRAKIAASYYHLLEARRHVSLGEKEEALSEYEKALAYDPMNRAIADEARLLEEREDIEKEKLRKEIFIEPPIKLKVTQEEVQLKFVESNLRSIYLALGKFAGVNILFDEQFKDQAFSLNLSDMNFEEALDVLCIASKNFYRAIDEKTIIIIPDQPAKRAQYELSVIRTFYLSNVIAQDIQAPLAQMLRTQFRVPAIIIDKNLNSVTIRDDPENIKLAEKLIRLWDKAKGEVVIDLEIMEVSRIKLRQLGLDFDQNLVGLKYGRSTEDEESGENKDRG